MVDDGPRFEFVCLTVTIDKLLREEDRGRGGCWDAAVAADAAAASTCCRSAQSV